MSCDSFLIRFVRYVYFRQTFGIIAKSLPESKTPASYRRYYSSWYILSALFGRRLARKSLSSGRLSVVGVFNYLATPK